MRKHNRWGQRDSLMVTMAWTHALRVAELVRLEWADIDLQRGTVFVRRVKDSEHGRHNLLGKELRGLRELRREWPAGDFVFASERGGPFTEDGFRKILQRAVAELKSTGRLSADAPDNPHALRHGNMTWLAIEKRLGLLELQTHVGHRQIANTRRYIREVPTVSRANLDW
jgi:integrase